MVLQAFGCGGMAWWFGRMGGKAGAFMVVSTFKIKVCRT